ncbi:hypothetical protein [Synechococcus sp. PCC 7336]|uniref:hypothetical protein n=1 Tax=Synechococcus sp. PCC 7336 TaxID=195250 RepID=UPI0005712DBA|nr:hypothetical protein [Synechococcus sp. PCC 7336]
MQISLPPTSTHLTVGLRCCLPIAIAGRILFAVAGRILFAVAGSAALVLALPRSQQDSSLIGRVR